MPRLFSPAVPPGRVRKPDGADVFAHGGRRQHKSRAKRAGRLSKIRQAARVPCRLGGFCFFEKFTGSVPLPWGRGTGSQATIRPSSIRTIRSALWAISGLWVIITIVW